MRRLKSLRLKNYRCHRDTGEICFDADVILIHGTNGTGKSSLLSGLEFALTGRSADLSQHGHDYPRSLRTCGTEIVEASARFLGGDGKVHTSSSQFSSHGKLVADTPLSEQDRQFFSERSFLSQSRLGRLLELYQGEEHQTGEQLLTRFVRELLGIERLDALCEGLYVAGDRRRLQKASAEYREIVAKSKHLNDEIKNRLSELKAVGMRIREVSASIDKRWRSGPREEPLSASELQFVRRDIQTALAQFDQELSRSAGSSSQIREASQRWMTIRSTERLADHAAAEVFRDLQHLRQENASRREKLAHELGVYIRDFRSVTNKSILERSDIDLAADRLRDEVEEALSLVSDREARMRRLTERHKEATAREQLLAAELDRIMLRLSSASATRSLHGVLSALLPHVESNECPVCSRNFSETGQGPLNDHLKHTLERMGTDIEALLEISREKERIQNSLAAIQSEREAAEAEVLRLEKIRERDADIKNIASELLGRINRNKPLLDEIRLADEKINSLSTIVSRRAKVENDEKRLRSEISSMIGSDIQPDAMDSAIFIYERQLADQENSLRGRINLTRQELERVELAAELVRESDDLTQKLEGLRAQAVELDRTIKEINRVVTDSRNLMAEADQARRHIVSQVFNTNLNQVWQNLCDRLMPYERFRPAFAQPEYRSGKLRLELNAIAPSGEPFRSLASVLSSGNLNTAALTLFLALNLSVRPRLPLLVLDDPVQNMDDVHVVELASLLRHLRSQGGRQIVVAVHERSLFDYLASELLPANEGQALQIIELSSGDNSTVINQDHISWAPDPIFAQLR